MKDNIEDHRFEVVVDICGKMRLGLHMYLRNCDGSVGCDDAESRQDGEDSELHIDGNSSLFEDVR